MRKVTKTLHFLVLYKPNACLIASDEWLKSEYGADQLERGISSGDPIGGRLQSNFVLVRFTTSKIRSEKKAGIACGDPGLGRLQFN